MTSVNNITHSSGKSLVAINEYCIHCEQTFTVYAFSYPFSLGCSQMSPQISQVYYHLAFHAFSDADWVGDPCGCTSTTGFILYLSNVLISWSSRKQRIVARSSTESEYRAVAITAAEVQWVKSLLQELGLSIPTPTIYCDNISTTYTYHNLVLYSKMKHLEIDIYFVRDLVHRGDLRVSHISSKD
jgi:hypothetical protein